MKGKLYLTIFLEISEDVTNSLDENEGVVVAFLGVQLAFSKTSQENLLDKLRKHLVGGKYISWLGTWLTNGKQSCVK